MKRHILIVDDNPVDTKKVSAILENDGFIPIVANSAVAALDLLGKYRLDLAILDIHLPITNGFQLAKEIRARPDSKNLMIMMMSGTYKEKDDVNTALKAGANDFILKPIDSEILSAKVAGLLTKQMPWGEWPVSGDDGKGFLKVEIQVVSISEMGIRIFSNVPLALKSSPQIEIPLLSNLEIHSPTLQVLECVKSGAGYSAYLTFVGMSESHMKEIRLLCRTLGIDETDRTKKS